MSRVDGTAGRIQVGACLTGQCLHLRHPPTLTLVLFTISVSVHLTVIVALSSEEFYFLHLVTEDSILSVLKLCMLADSL